MTDIVAFIRARLAEDQERAEDAAIARPGRWWPEEIRTTPFDPDRVVVSSRNGQVCEVDEESPLGARHIGEHDPERALLGVEAKRKLLAAYETALAQSQSTDENVAFAGAAIVGALREPILAFAAEWVSHPDFAEARW